MALNQEKVVILAGPKLLGYFFNWALLGVLTIQTYLYHVNFPHDPLVLQCLVYGMLAFELVQTGLVTGVAFEIFVYNYGDTNSLTKIYYAWFFVAVMCAIVSVTVQLFFAWRIYVLARSRIVAGVIALLSLLQACAGISLGVLLKDTPSTADVTASHQVVIVLNLWVVGSAVVDALIAVTMTILMLRLRRGTTYKHTERMINKVIRLVVETGTLTAGVAIVTLVLCLRLPGTQYYETTIYVLTKLYANTFLANLVSRAFLESPDAGSVATRPISFAFPAARDTESSGNITTLEAGAGDGPGDRLPDAMKDHEKKTMPVALIDTES
ncbi:uncharacterized protein B0H18DRAFT_286318 [Fomitopsis serialis]|uniref:uncharacterized protein n=1 Tax=Fomitopsis serialis TaxID=139415 RepID=UPI0020083FDF|nr:uncharacterized protein B0H18DRAFT_286318 [Neoantrodia serialis]KAH9911988.1 hypothetical protein B0H18DRAFT_286318 [Neoantrodia serialis]